MIIPEAEKKSGETKTLRRSWLPLFVDEVQFRYNRRLNPDIF
jgi:hypothetical protein